MKNRYLYILLIWGLLFLISCEKEQSFTSDNSNEFHNITNEVTGAHSEFSHVIDITRPDNKTLNKVKKELKGLLKEDGVIKFEKEYGKIKWKEGIINYNDDDYISVFPMVKGNEIKALVQFFKFDEEIKIDFRTREMILTALSEENSDPGFLNLWFNAISKFSLYREYLSQNEKKQLDLWLMNVSSLQLRPENNTREYCQVYDLEYEYIEYCGIYACALVAAVIRVTLCYESPTFAPPDYTGGSGGGGGGSVTNNDDREALITKLKNERDLLDPCNTGLTTNQIIDEFFSAFEGTIAETEFDDFLANTGIMDLSATCPLIACLVKDLKENSLNGVELCDIVRDLLNDQDATLIHKPGLDFKAVPVFNSNMKQIRILYPSWSCNTSPSHSWEDISARYIHELLHAHLLTLGLSLNPNATNSDFYPGADIYTDIVNAYFPGSASTNQHYLMVMYMRDFIIDGLYALNGQLGNKIDYEYWAHLVLNTETWIVEGFITENELGGYDLQEMEQRWNNLKSNYGVSFACAGY